MKIVSGVPTQAVPQARTARRPVVPELGTPDVLSRSSSPDPLLYYTRQPIPTGGAVLLHRPLWARMPEDMGDLLMPSLPALGLPASALAHITRALVEKPDVVPVQILTDAEGHPRRLGELGSNPLFLCTLPGDKKGVFKSMEPIDDMWAPRMKEESAREIVASHLMKELGVHSITYRAAVGTVEGESHEGVASEFVAHRTLLHDPSLVDALADPCAVVRASVIDAWMGNFDRIVNDGNVWVQPDGKVVFGDYGCTFRKGLTACGVPKVNTRLFRRHGRAEYIEPVVDEIRRLSDRDIKRMVERAGAYAPTLTLSQRAAIVDVLVSNRDALRRENPFSVYYAKPFPAGFHFSPEAGKALAHGALRRFGADGAPPAEVAARLGTNIRGYEPLHGTDIHAVRSTLQQMIEADVGGTEACPLVQPEHFIAWQQVCKMLISPEKSLELGLGVQ